MHIVVGFGLRKLREMKYVSHDKQPNARNNDKVLLYIPYSTTYSTGVAVVGSWDVAKNGNRYNWKGWSHQTYANRVFIVRSYWSPPLLYHPRIYCISDQISVRVMLGSGHKNTELSSSSFYLFHSL